MGESFTYQTVERIFTLGAGGWHFLFVFFFINWVFFYKVPWYLLVEGAPRESAVNMVWLITENLVQNFLKLTVF